MPPREARCRPRHLSSKRESKRESNFQLAAQRVLGAVRALRLRQRLCSSEFEVRPDREELPLYYQMISDPVFLVDLDHAIASGRINSPDSLASRFKVLVRNAKTFNKPGSTISKDASRLFEAFRIAMRQEFNFKVDEYEDENEEDAWARDLAERTKRALLEREAYHELQISWLRKKPGMSRTERAWKQSTLEPLIVFNVPSERISKKELSRTEFVENASKLKLAGSTSSARGHHDLTTCPFCSLDAVTPEQEKDAMQLVLTPKYREIVSVTQKARSSPLGHGKALKRRHSETSSQREKLQKMTMETYVSNRKRSESPDTVSAMFAPLGRSRRGLRVKF